MSVPDRIHVCFRNDIGLYTLASSVTVEVAYPLANLQSNVANEPTVFDMTGEDTIAITWSSATAAIAGGFAIHNHTLLHTDTARLRLYAGESQTGTVVYDSTALGVYTVVPWGVMFPGDDPWGVGYERSSRLKKHFSVIFENVSYKSALLEISAPAAATPRAIDKLFIGPSWCPRWGQEWGWVSRARETSEQQEKPGGGIDTVERPVVRELAMTFEGTDNVERAVWRRIQDEAGMGGDMLIVPDPNDVKGMKFESSSIYKRTSVNEFAEQFYNGSSHELRATEN